MPVISRRSVLGGVAMLPWAGGRVATARPVRLPLASALAADPLRPQYHLIAPYGWMNDPCGPVWVRGRYHMFYQWGPDKAAFGDIHWGHAVSTDLVHWRNLPAALSPQPGGPDAQGVFSGCVVIDGARAVAFYTGIEPSVQCMATSDLDMMHWTRHPEPVIATPPEGLQVEGFRDPMVWKDGTRWCMVLGANVHASPMGPGGVVLLYDSPDLLTWTYRRVLYGPTHIAGGYDDAMECPDFFALGASQVLVYSLGDTVYAAVGTFGQDRFHVRHVAPLGYGSFYAARTMLDADGRRVVWGWIPEKPGRAKTAMQAGWNGVMSLPRVMTIGEDGLARVAPHPAIAMLEGPVFMQGAGHEPRHTDGPNARIRVSFSGQAPGRIIFGGRDAFLDLDYDPYRPGRELIANGDAAPLPLADHSTLDILVDASVIEIFASSGIGLSTRAYGDPAGPFVLKMQGTFESASIQARRMTPISPDRLTADPEPTGG
ncbi:glycoside hydrolase family 32 protein [Komagataeibacter oboediens]|uniref:glycoside hydrolase family 32 protein n=1 Tax=Komagataeibacter oboediens TaxID=65958 RepID=UPI001C2D5E08|nr:glycoside hydrolase family 32 protein [Komagataeibacter oboediens]MBV1822802.1 glycoside hydrolase family 32 protein [Komagataeibacter oboediens]